MFESVSRTREVINAVCRHTVGEYDVELTLGVVNAEIDGPQFCIPHGTPNMFDATARRWGITHAC